MDNASPKATLSVTSRILAGVFAGWGQAVVGLVVAFVQIRLILDHLPTDLAGVWFLFLTLAGYIALFDLGISPTLSREIGFALGGEQERRHAESRIADLLKTSLLIFMGIAGVTLVASLVGGLWFLGTVAPAVYLAEVRLAWVVFAVGAALNILSGAAFAALFGLGSVGTERWIRALTQLIGLSLLALALMLGWGIVGIAAAWVAQGITAMALGWVVLLMQYPFLRTARGRMRRAVAQLIALPSLKWAAMAFGSVLILNTDNVIIATFLGTEQIPAYEVVAKLITTGMMLSLLVVTSSMPFASRAHAADDRATLLTLLSRNLRYGMGFMVVLAALLLAYGEVFIGLWLGPGRFVGYPILIAFVVLLTLEAHHRIHATFVVSTGRLVFHWWALGAGVLNLVFSLFLVQRYGLLGVALGTVAAQLLTNNWFAPFYALRLFDIRIRTYLWDVVLPLAVLFGVALGSAMLIRSLVPGTWPAFWQLMLGSAVSGTASLLCFAALLVETGERRQFAGPVLRWLKPKGAV